MTAASHSLATALWKARFASGLLMKCYTTSWDTIRKALGRYPLISLSEARTEAKRLLAERLLGSCVRIP